MLDLLNLIFSYISEISSLDFMAYIIVTASIACLIRITIQVIRNLSFK